MADIHLHIISFDVPYPPNYGGIIDVFYKAQTLTEKGVKVHLHCFEYGRNKAAELEKLFFKVHYYKRDISKKHLFKNKPYIVETRRSEKLIDNLLNDDYPILMEGLHSTALLRDKRLKNRKKLVRTHNIEHDYYSHLSLVETDFFKKYYFFNEAVKLKKYESILTRADAILTISQADYEYFSKKFERVVYLPAFHPHTTIQSIPGKGDYVLYHGKLSVPENIHAITKLLNEVFHNEKIPVKIAGLNPPASLKRLVNSNPMAELIANPTDAVLQKLIAQAHIHVFYTDQATGLKLKLLNALYNGRFVLTNNKMVSGSNLHNVCVIANNMIDMKKKIKNLMEQEFTSDMRWKRERYLKQIYTNGDNAERLIELIV